VVALNKIDLVDPEWLALVEEEIRALLQGTCWEAAPIVPVSARTRAGLEALVAALQQALEGQPPPPDLGRARLHRPGLHHARLRDGGDRHPAGRMLSRWG
jgi:selenocysteine-specific elongation factor